LSKIIPTSKDSK